MNKEWSLPEGHIPLQGKFSYVTPEESEYKAPWNYPVVRKHSDGELGTTNISRDLHDLSSTHSVLRNIWKVMPAYKHRQCALYIIRLTLLVAWRVQTNNAYILWLSSLTRNFSRKKKMWPVTKTLAHSPSHQVIGGSAVIAYSSLHWAEWRHKGY